MDPTGPLHWLAFWPQKDPQAELPPGYYEEYDHDLSLILDVLHFAILADSKTERKYKFWVHFRDAVRQVKPEILGCWGEERLRGLLNDLLIRESNKDPESELAGDSESCSSDEDAAQVSQPPDVKDSDASSSLAPPAYCPEPGEASTPADGEQGVEDGGSEIQKLREELQRTQDVVAEQQRELHRMQKLVTEIQSEKVIGKDVNE